MNSVGYVRASWVGWVTVCLIVVTGAGLGDMVAERGGQWPGDWPKELEGFRARARTVRVTGEVHEQVYELRFKSREEFEGLWPVLMQVRTEGTPITLHGVSADPSTDGDLPRYNAPRVHLYGPSTGQVIREEGGEVSVGPPWAESLLGGKAGLPEYVETAVGEGGLKWVAASGKRGDGEKKTRYRARVEVHLVVDGRLIDLDRLRFPSDARIIDLRGAIAPRNGER